MKILIAVMLLVIGMADAAEDSRFTQPHDQNHPWSFSPAFTERAAWEDRAQTLRQQALVAQGLWPMLPKTPLNPVIHSPIDRDAYTIEKVYFASLPGHYVSGNLYRPTGKSGKLPGVLAPYGHWPDGRFWWRDEAGIKKEIDSYYGGGMKILDSSEIIAAALKKYLESEGILNSSDAQEQHFLVSDFTDSFEASARMFFHEAVHLERHPLWT